MKHTNRRKILSVTAADCEWQYFRGSGDGGQKRQKTSSGARCIHEPSGAVGEASDTRFQLQNRKLAFERMFNSDDFQSWLKLKIEASKGNIEIEETNEHGHRITRPLRIDEI